MRNPIHIPWAIRLLPLLLCLQGLVACSDAWQGEEEGDASQKTSFFEWTRADDQSTRYAFLRNYGVGYSYNAVEGEYCNWNDIRCQVVNRNVLERLEENLEVPLYGHVNMRRHPKIANTPTTREIMWLASISTPRLL